MAQAAQRSLLQTVSLRKLLATAVLGTIALTLVFGASLSTLHAVEKVRTEMEAAIAVGARIARNAVDDVDERSKPRRRLELLVADFDGDRHLRAFFVNPDGSVAAASRLAVPEEPVPGWLIDFIGHEPIVVSVALPSAFHGYGGLALQTDARNEIGEVWADTMNLLAILAVFCALIVGLSLLALRWILDPLRVLSQGIADVGNRPGSARPLAESGPMELVAVCRGFNDMVVRLEAAEARSAALNDQLAHVQEEERAEIARDLHDEMAPLLFAMDVDTAAVTRACGEGNSDAALMRLELVRGSIDHLKRNVRDLLGILQPAALVDLGLAHAVGQLAQFWRKRHPGLVLTTEVPPYSLGATVDAVVYRVVQESLNNALRHGAPRRISVRVSDHDGDVVVEIDNDGGGLGPEAAPRSGYGIRGMTDRIAALGGSLSVRNSADGRGVMVRARIPGELAETLPGRALGAPHAVVLQ
ncbi:MAG: histidine kinase [Hyphomicrobiaceae bacterium]|nr:histidine kinase [Hyphomicrobiaceae bacterium]